MPKTNQQRDKSTWVKVKCMTCYKCGRFYTFKSNDKLCKKLFKLHLQRCNVAVPISKEQNDALNSLDNIQKHWSTQMGGGKIIINTNKLKKNKQ